jgi:hypothetical protein
MSALSSTFIVVSLILLTLDGAMAVRQDNTIPVLAPTKDKE